MTAGPPAAARAGLDGASSALGPQHRAWSRERMEREVFDVVVVGGGVTGAGAALDAATRGLSVALIEARDYAAGASSKSSKLIHGGLRYLEMLDFGLVREALRERRLLLTELAPHLVKPVPFLWPLTHKWWERPYVGAGLVLYDTMGGRKAVPRARHLTRTRALRIAPALRADALVGAVQFYDAQEDDARMVVFLARTAAAHGAALATNIRADGLISAGGRVQGVRALDLLSGGELVVRARQVAMATGAWTSRGVGLGGAPGAGGGGGAGGAAPRLQVRPSKGVHIVIPRERIPMDTGLLTRTEKSVLFVIPWGDHWIIGDTDTEWRYDPAYPTASRADIDYLLGKVNQMLRDPVTAADVEGVFAGLRPLVAAGGAGAGGAGAGGGADGGGEVGGRGETTRLSREHAVDTSAAGVTTIAGGKFTTYRVMARDLIDAAVRDLGPGVPSSRTHEVPLIGAAGYPGRWESRQLIAARSGLGIAQVERLLGRYGSCIDDLLELIGGRPALRLPVRGAGGYLGAEVVYACTHEGAVHLDDVLSRRTRMAFEVRDGGLEAAPQVAALMAAELGWDEARAEREISRYRDSVAAEREAQQAPDDLLAITARLRAHDPAAADGSGLPGVEA